jgi:hypothetical protein
VSRILGVAFTKMEEFLAGSVAGALASETKESILQQELEKLQDKKVLDDYDGITCSDIITSRIN